MNVIGQAVVGLSQWYKIAPAQELLVIYDELDLPFGTLRLRERGSAGTHNGMKSVVGQLGSQLFPRLRIGIGQGPPERDAASYVLARFPREEQAQVRGIITRAAAADGVGLREDLIAVMNKFNVSEKKKLED